MIARSFVDTNIFVYSRDSVNSSKRKKALKLITTLRQANLLIISYQVVTEFIAVMDKKYKAPQEELKKDVRLLLDLKPIPVDESVIQQGLKLHQQYNLSWWDAWIVASSILAGCKQLYSEDLASGASYHGVEVVNPFI